MKRKELDGVILRWKKTTRALRIHEQVYGKYITDLLEKRTDAELALFSDPVEAAAFFCLLDLVEKISDLPWQSPSDPLGAIAGSDVTPRYRSSSGSLSHG
nr:hypothetical protein [uncultured Methanoregula sp.]